jgi:hypothetical protein
MKIMKRDATNQKKTMSIGNYCLMLTAKLRDDPPVARRSAYICFNCSIPGAPIKTTYGINSVLLCNSLRALGAQSRIHIFPGKEKKQSRESIL